MVGSLAGGNDDGGAGVRGWRLADATGICWPRRGGRGFEGVTRSYRVKGTSRVGGGSSVKCCGDVFTSTVLIRANESTNAGKHYI